MFSLQLCSSVTAFPQIMTTAPTRSIPKFSMASTQLCADSKEVKERKPRLAFAASMARENVEIFKSMEDWARGSILPLLKPVEKSWQPGDLLPDSGSDGFVEQINELRERTQEIPDDCLVALVGNMITEEALPTYQARINAVEMFHDETGTDSTPWAIWSRGWSAEENRHGDLLNKYLYLSGRIDIKQVEKTIQHLIASGMNLGTGNNPYHWSIYTAIQERAAFITHCNTAKLALRHGDSKLAKICGTIAADEKRHETAYSRIVGKLFELDPSGSMVAFAEMLKIKIIMPSYLMYDGHDINLSGHFFNVSMRIGIFTTTDYVSVLEHLVDLWNIKKLEGLTSEARRAQDYVCRFPERLRKIEERARARMKQAPAVRFSWVFNREV